jgi:long-subunit acyl-CoA synthetase (AMP-forming)
MPLCGDTKTTPERGHDRGMPHLFRPLLVQPESEPSSLVRALNRQVTRQPKNVALRGKQDGIWRDVTWLDWWDHSARVAAALLALGVEPGQRVAIIANNRVEWVEADMGILMAGGVTTHVYASATSDQVAFILRDSGARAAFFDDPALLRAITDRKKDVFKTSGGKQIAPAPLEQALVTASRLISRAVVCGANRPYVSALLTLDEEALRGWASANGCSGSLAELSREPALRALLERAVHAANADLARFETIKKFAILERDFSLETAELTPTTKLRRDTISKRYAATVDALYTSDPPHERSSTGSPDM